MSIKDRNLTPGTKLVAKYHKEQHTCQVIQGEGDKVRYKLEDGREFKSPSAAGMAITGHACDGWVFWSLETPPAPAPETPNPEANQNVETAKETNPGAPENASLTEPASAPAARPEDAPETDTVPAAPEANPAKKTFFRTPNQKGVENGMTRWFCQTCGESFLAPYGEIPAGCPQGHKAS